VQYLNILARLLLVRSLKSVTLGNRVAVKGTVEEGIEELFCEGRVPFVLGLLRAGNDFGRFQNRGQKESEFAIIPETKDSLGC